MGPAATAGLSSELPEFVTRMKFGAPASGDIEGLKRTAWIAGSGASDPARPWKAMRKFVPSVASEGDAGALLNSSLSSL